jgi:two-component system, chemotaxis family, chemotaxis protein CheY
LNVLLVDDNRVMRRAVRKALLASGLPDLVVEEVDNGCDALAKLDQIEPDLILCDWRMPEMNGVELLRELRSRGDDVKFGFVTMGATEQMRETATRAGAQFLIDSPLNAAHFSSVLQRYF